MAAARSLRRLAPRLREGPACAGTMAHPGGRPDAGEVERGIEAGAPSISLPKPATTAERRSRLRSHASESPAPPPAGRGRSWAAWPVAVGRVDAIQLSCALFPQGGPLGARRDRQRTGVIFQNTSQNKWDHSDVSIPELS